MSRLAWFAASTLAYNVSVILWGAYVRASGSGAGCGSHWPLCNGQVLPRGPSVETLIEFSHRLTSGLALVAVVVLWGWTRKAFEPEHPARRSALIAVGLILTEAAIGAGIVLFELVADNATMARALFMAVHLANTFLLLAALTLTAHWTTGGNPVSLSRHPLRTVAVMAASLGVLLVGTSGAIAALGDTLYPSTSLADAILADLSATSHLLIRLRILHPALATVVALTLAAFVLRFPLGRHRRGRRAAHAVVALALLQLAAGVANVALLAPIWLQMIHLLLADLLWIAFVIVAASTLAEQALAAPAPRRVPARSAL